MTEQDRQTLITIFSRRSYRAVKSKSKSSSSTPKESLSKDNAIEEEVKIEQVALIDLISNESAPVKSPLQNTEKTMSVKMGPLAEELFAAFSVSGSPVDPFAMSVEAYNYYKRKSAVELAAVPTVEDDLLGPFSPTRDSKPLKLLPSPDGTFPDLLSFYEEDTSPVADIDKPHQIEQESVTASPVDIETDDVTLGDDAWSDAVAIVKNKNTDDVRREEAKKSVPPVLDYDAKLKKLVNASDFEADTKLEDGGFDDETDSSDDSDAETVIFVG